MSWADFQDRAAGCLVGCAYGDALGVPYEYGSRSMDEIPQMLGGGLGNFEPGEWSDDTSMTVAVALGAVEAPLTSEDGLDAAADQFERWFASGPPDVGIQTANVLRDAAMLDGRPAHRLRTAAAALHAQTGRTAGNGALMRTAPVALALHGNRDAIASAARAVAELTHPDPLAGDSCVLWCLAIDTALRHDPFDLRPGLALIPDDRRDYWRTAIDTADRGHPQRFEDNGFTVTALQAAWAGIVHSRARGVSTAERMLVDAIHAGGDTDTVGAIAGALIGAWYGTEAFPPREPLHGWPGYTQDDLVDLAHQLVGG